MSRWQYAQIVELSISLSLILVEYHCCDEIVYRKEQEVNCLGFYTRTNCVFLTLWLTDANIVFYIRHDIKFTLLFLIVHIWCFLE